jgi:MFS family permease
MLGAAGLTTLAALPVFLLSAQSVLVREDLGFSEPQLGLAVSAFFGSAALTSMSAGALVERLGRRTGTLVAGALAVVTGLSIALAAHTYVALLVFLVLGGVANAALQMTANVTLARSVAPHRRGLAFGVKQSAVQVAVLLGGLAVPTVGVVLGWRWTFAAAALAAVAVVLAGLRVPAASPAARRQAEPADRPPGGALVVSAVAMMLASASVNAMGSFLPAWAFDVGLTPGTAGLLVAAGSALSVLVRVLSGVVADRRKGRNMPVVSAYLVAGGVGMWMVSLGGVPMLVAGSLLAFAIGWAWPGLFLFAVVRMGRDSPATASGAVQGGAFAGGAAGPLLFGLMVASFGYPAAWRTAAVVILVAAALLLVARRMFVVDLTRRPPRRPLDSWTPAGD